MKSFLFFSLVVSVYVICLLGSAGCANIVPPQGGPRDSLPPLLLNADPDDSTLNFRGDRITLTFDEYVDLQEVQNNLLFTPTLPTTPDVQVRLKTIVIRLRDTLDPNTTYIFNFGNAIKDFNEGNVLRNFVYTFSTGPALDSLQLSGKVVIAETGAIDTTLTVILHKNLDDSAVVKDRPRYVTRLDKDGSFTFKNLPAGTFAIYALGDAGIARRYQSKQFFAFNDSPVVVRPGSAPILLNAYRETPVTVMAPAAAPPAGRSRNSSEKDRLRFSTNLAGGGQQDLLRDFVITFERPLRTLDTTAISLSTDTTYQRVAYTSLLDSTRRILTIKAPWIENRRYNLVTEKNFAEDTLGLQLLKGDTLTFQTRRRGEYGSVSLRIKGWDSLQNGVIQFVQNNSVLSSFPVNGAVYTQPLFLPGDYELRLLEDRNGNGVWDAGRFFGIKRQPETVRLLRRITVRPAFANDFELVL